MAVPDRIIRLKSLTGLLISALALAGCVWGYVSGCSSAYLLQSGSSWTGNELYPGMNVSMQALTLIHCDQTSRLFILVTGFYAFLVSLYSLNRKNTKQFYPYLLITLGTANGAMLADHLLVFLFFWGILGITLYKLAGEGSEEGASAAKKALILIGASDCLMMLGIAILWQMNLPLSFSTLHVSATGVALTAAFLCLLTGAFTKAGAFPFHTWVPDFTETAPAQSSAYLPASLDKLLGIYFMFRLCSGMFSLNGILELILISLAVLTIIAGVMMALVQHNYKRLLGYHAVSQVGYMVLGLALGSPLAIAGGLFHMVNHTVYKSGLFLVAGNIERRTGKTEIESLGGLARSMPVTFVSAVVFALAISGVPPLNGFASKWLIYQGIIEAGRQPGIANDLWILWLGLAVIGSALTLASFLKFLSGIFLGRSQPESQGIKEAGPTEWFPVAFLALVCILLGVAANLFFIPRMIMPLSGIFTYPGLFNSGTLGLLVAASIVLGILFYLPGRKGKFRTDDSFIGGEQTRTDREVNVTEFYHGIIHAPVFSGIYSLAWEKWFDLYDILKKGIFGFSDLLSRCHTGMLPLYAIWIMAGLIILMLCLT